MKRNQSTLLGVLLAAVALIVVASGCTSSNPVAPDSSSDVVFENPQSTPYYPNGDDPTQFHIDADRVADIEDITADQGLSKPRPDITDIKDGVTAIVADRDLVDDIALNNAID